MNQRGLILQLFLLLVPVGLLAQIGPSVFLVSFTDKANTPYSLAEPEAFLSERALARRAAQGIALDETDLPVDPAYIAAVLAQGDVQLVNRSKWFNAITIRCTDQAALDAIAGLPFVTGIEPTRMLVGGMPDESKFGAPGEAITMRGGEGDYGPSFGQIAQLNGHLLHEMDAKGQGMLIGVLDSGFDGTDVLPAFEALRDRGGIVLTRDMVTHDGDVYADHWHGRSVLSCMAGVLEGQLIGTAPLADYVLLRTEDVGSEYLVEEDNWVAAAEVADSIGCDILNTSLGYTVFDDSLQDHQYADLDGLTTRMSIAAGMAARKGMIPVNSAGNAGSSDWYHISVPADAIDILAVGAVNINAESAPFSGHGPSADGRVKPDVCAVGWGAIGLRAAGDSIAPINGTSFSSPIIAGLVACLWQLHPERSAHDIMDAVRRSASHFNTPDADFGFGIPDFMQAHEWLTMTTAVNEIGGQASLAVHPVPFSDRLTITVPEGEGLVRISLHDAAGRTVWSGQATEACRHTLHDAALGALADGFYVLRLEGAGRSLSTRVVKAR